jgi:adenine-specific DNA-methyltransferase
MNKIVMISGSRSIKDISPGLESITKIMELEFSIILGDAPGVDKLVQEYLRSQNYPNVKVYYALWSGNGKPRNVTGFETVGVAGSYVDRDKMMCSVCNYGLALWDGASRGTRDNIDRTGRKTKIIRIRGT